MHWKSSARKVTHPITIPILGNITSIFIWDPNPGLGFKPPHSINYEKHFLRSEQYMYENNNVEKFDLVHVVVVVVFFPFSLEYNIKKQKNN